MRKCLREVLRTQIPHPQMKIVCRYEDVKLSREVPLVFFVSSMCPFLSRPQISLFTSPFSQHDFLFNFSSIHYLLQVMTERGQIEMTASSLNQTSPVFDPHSRIGKVGEM